MVNYAEMNYLDAIKAADASSTSFDCDSGCKFLETLAEAGYDEYTRIATEYRAGKVGSGLTADACTGEIYIDGRDCYAEISIHRYSVDRYGVDMEIRPASFSRIQNNNAMADAIAKMSGDA